MAQQVKFYSTTASDFDSANKDAAGIYFVNGGEIYKGSERFGANKVWESKPADNAGVISGDMVFISGGAVQVFDGTSWRQITNKASGWSATSFGGGDHYIQSINQLADGTVTAVAVSFPTLSNGSADGTLKLGSGADAKVAGWDTVKTDISNLQSVVSYSGTGDKTVTADTGTFEDLTVRGTASFTATTISATTLTVDTEAGATFGSSTISQIAQREAQTKINALAGSSSSSSNGVKVDVTTAKGEVTAVTVSVDATTGTSDFTSTSTKIAKAGDVAKYVDSKLLNINGAMRFYGTTTATTAATVAPGNITKADSSFTAIQAGDVVINTTYATEYIYDGKAWHELGDESHHSTKGFTGEGSVTLTTSASTLAGGINELDKELGTITASEMGTTASTVSGAIKELDGKVDILTGADTVEGSVAKAEKDAKAYTDTKVNDVTTAFTGGEDTNGTAGVSVKVATAAKSAAPTVTVTVTKDKLNATLGTTAFADKTVATSIGATGVDTALATEKAVRDAIKDATLVWLNASGGVIA